MQKINKEIYLKKRLEKKGESLEKRRDLCFKCFRSEKNCLCAEIVPFDPEIKVILLIHPMELKRERVGTGRLSHLCLKNSELIMGIDFTNDRRVNSLLADENYFPMLLYPGENSINLSKKNTEISFLQKKKLLLFVIDGTWPCAKKIMRLSKNLHEIPRLSFETSRKSEFLVKEQPGDFCLSTIEALHEFLTIWEAKMCLHYGEQLENLMKVFRKMVQFQVSCLENDSLPSYRSKKKFTLSSDRKKSKKWNNRKIFY